MLTWQYSRLDLDEVTRVIREHADARRDAEEGGLRLPELLTGPTQCCRRGQGAIRDT